jgi:Icc-related predicted phosphoesterase
MFFFVSDLHGLKTRYEALLGAIESDRPKAVLLGGDLLPLRGREEFLDDLAGRFASLRSRLGESYPRVLLILGNDDPRVHEAAFRQVEEDGLWTVLHNRCERIDGIDIYGYPFVPPTPFLLKDWERYDVSHFVDPGCIAPEDGVRSVEVDANEPRYATIEADLQRLTADANVDAAIFLFHTPPYQTNLDRAALDGRSVDHAPLDVNVGSIAVRRFIETRQPRLTLHGHVHESARITGRWMDRINRTILLGAAHDGPELALIRFDPEAAELASRALL